MAPIPQPRPFKEAVSLQGPVYDYANSEPQIVTMKFTI